MTAPMLLGRSIVAGAGSTSAGASFHGFNPVDGLPLEPAFFSASRADVESAVSAAEEAAPVFAEASGALRGRLLRAIAAGLDAASEALVARAQLETALPLPRLTGEVARTSGQMRLFASAVEEGSWVDARIDLADPGRTPPKPDLRSMLRPLGPVAVFGASNFPLAFSVAGGDTASALAAGNPVIVKAHPAHPGTSELVGRIVAAAVSSTGLPPGVFSLLFDAGHEVGAALVQHPGVRAVGFTGSFSGGRALLELAARRAEPIPVFAEMGSSNPVFLLPGALAERAASIADGLHASFTLGAGQFCTKPGIVFLLANEEASAALVTPLRERTVAGPGFTLLTAGIASAYAKGLSARSSLCTAEGKAAASGFAAQATLLETTGDAFLADASLSNELFGPVTLLVYCSSKQQIMQAAQSLEGHLTATVHGTDEDLHAHAELLKLLETKVGRIVINSFPTGVEVAHAMVHGGPWPATSDGRSTSVGSQAMLRFVRPVAYQGLPQWALPPELQDGNPCGILRLVNGAYEPPRGPAASQ